MSLSTTRAALALALLVPWLHVPRAEACGPQCAEPEEEEDVLGCLAGNLGDLATRGPRCRAMAFLLLNGKGLAPEDREAVATALVRSQARTAATQDIATPWLEARARVPGVAPLATGHLTTDAPIESWFFPNCLAGSFSMAARTLEARLAELGPEHPEVSAWVAAQDSVFTNCGGGPLTLPEPLPSGASARARADHAYQVAAAYFYAGAYEEALERLEAIGADPASPWRGWAQLAAVRTLLRQASMRAETDEERRALWGLARSRAEQLQRTAPSQQVALAAQQLLWFTQARLEPQRQLGRLAAYLPQRPDANFAYAWNDYFTLRESHVSEDELSAFLDSFEREDGYAVALGWWRQRRSLPWLMAALTQARNGRRGVAELQAAAGSVPPDSPAYVTVRSARARLALEAERLDMARAELQPLLDKAQGLPPETAELLAARMQQVARSFEEYARVAQLSPGVAEFFDAWVPLARLADPKVLAALAPPLRREVVLAGWVRAVLLERWEVERALEPALAQAAPELAADLARVAKRSQPQARKLAAVLLMLKAPGLKPYVQTYRTRGLKELDVCLGNGWCTRPAEDLTTRCQQQETEGDSCRLPRFFTAQELEAAVQESQKLAALEPGPEGLIRLVLEHAHAWPEDPLVPEALHYSVQQARGARTACTNAAAEVDARSWLSKQAYQLLHQRHRHSAWGEKTPYHY
jgi:hypothetical protein